MRAIRQLFSPLADNFLQVWTAQSSLANARSNDNPSLSSARISQIDSLETDGTKGADRSTKSTSGYEQLYTNYNKENSNS